VKGEGSGNWGSKRFQKGKGRWEGKGGKGALGTLKQRWKDGFGEGGRRVEKVHGIGREKKEEVKFSGPYGGDGKETAKGCGKV